jgi:hypothetical protein
MLQYQLIEQLTQSFLHILAYLELQYQFHPSIGPSCGRQVVHHYVLLFIVSLHFS